MVLLADLSTSETRLTIELDSFEYHVYNRTSNYSRLEKLFGLDQLISPQEASVVSKSPEKR